MNLPKSVLTKKQTKIFTGTTKEGHFIKATVRHDDECGNGHNSFAITGDIPSQGIGGCIHDEIAETFPELKPFIKWHLTSTDGPMHYVANSVYHASDRDCNSLKKGEVRSYKTTIKFGEFPIQAKSYRHKFVNFLKETGNPQGLSIVKIEHEPADYDYGPKYTFKGFGTKWYECPFDGLTEAEQFLEALQNYPIKFIDEPDSWGEGKEPKLAAARNSAVWPEAELEDFTKEKLEARLPALMEDFKQAVESLGMVY